MKLELLKVILRPKTTWLLGARILWILNNPRFNNLFKGQRDRKSVVFAKQVKIKFFWALFKYLLEGLVIP